MHKSWSAQNMTGTIVVADRKSGTVVVFKLNDLFSLVLYSPVSAFFAAKDIQKCFWKTIDLVENLETTQIAGVGGREIKLCVPL